MELYGYSCAGRTGACGGRQAQCTCCCCPPGPPGPPGRPGSSGPPGPPGPSGPFLSCFMEALGNAQQVPAGRSIVFDLDTSESVGNCITLSADGTVFTIHRTGLYQIEWSLNLGAGTGTAVAGILENGAPASGASTTGQGNFASGTLIEVDQVPFTVSLLNYAGPITLEQPAMWENSAASIRIIRFADAPSV